MSLDVYLTGKTERKPCVCRECDNAHERDEAPTFYSSNITHNLGRMAQEAGIYKHCWHPEELSITKAVELIEPLRAGLKLLESDPEKFKQFDASNGWGRYIHFVPWLREYLKACEEYPEANVSTST